LYELPPAERLVAFVVVLKGQVGAARKETRRLARKEFARPSGPRPRRKHLGTPLEASAGRCARRAYRASHIASAIIPLALFRQPLRREGAGNRTAPPVFEQLARANPSRLTMFDLRDDRPFLGARIRPRPQLQSAFAIVAGRADNRHDRANRRRRVRGVAEELVEASVCSVPRIEFTSAFSLLN
jgi:hypothetical protein